MSVRILTGDCRSALPSLADESVHCVVTSPPYFGLRDYGVAGQIGLEPTPNAFVAELVAVFREVRRVLRSDGTLWLNLGDSYAQSEIRHRNKESESSGLQTSRGKWSAGVAQTGRKLHHGLKPKDLIGIPWMVAFALRADGWWLRQDIIWSKPNPMPESVTDRCTKAHEYLFLLTKSERYFYDAEAIKEEGAPASAERYGYSFGGAKSEALIEANKTGIGQRTRVSGDREYDGTRNRRSVWTVATQPFAEAHFATFPPALIEPCILAGCPAKCCAKCGAPWVREVEVERVKHSNTPGKGGRQTVPGSETSASSCFRTGLVPRTTTLGFSPSCACAAATVPGTCLDPFGGAGTTGLVADRLQRNAILIELNADYATMARRRIDGDAPLFAEAAE